MRRFLIGVLVLCGIVTFASFATSQPFPTSIQIAVNQLTTGVTVFTNLRNAASAYVNWGSTAGTSGYGIRDNAGTMQFKNSGGSWDSFVGGSVTGAPATASYWTRVAESGLSNETALGALATGLVINTTTTGVPTIYAGVSCTNQFLRALSTIGAATCASVSLTADVAGILPVANGGIGLTSGTSGGILGYTASGTLASSGALTANALLLGGGAGATPSALGSLGTTTTVLHGNASGAPTFGAVVLSTDISGFGTGIASALAVNTGSAGAPVLFNGALGTPSSATLTNATGLPIVAGTTGNLSLARGGTGQALSDPGADRILFWDDSGNAVTWLTAGTGLQIIGTTLSATTTAVGGSNTQIQFNDGGIFGGDADLTWSKTTNVLGLAGSVLSPAYIPDYLSILAPNGDGIYMSAEADNQGGFVDLGTVAGENFTRIGFSGSSFRYFQINDAGLSWQAGVNLSTAASAFEFINIRTGNETQFARAISAPSTIENVFHIKADKCLGDNTTLIGCRTLSLEAIDDDTVASGTKGYLNGLSISLVPKIARNNSPIDDATGLHIQNNGTHSGTDASYFGHSASVLDAVDWTGAIITSDAKAVRGLWMKGAMTTGVDIEEFSTTGAVFKATEGADAVFTFAADQGDDATDTWTMKVAATGNALSFINNSNSYFVLSTAGALTGPASLQSALYTTTTNCSDSAGDAACGAAPAGSVVVDAADTNTVVSTTAVTANSQILVVDDVSLGTRLGVTCNTTVPADLRVTARTAGTSFTVTVTAPAVNPLCLSYWIIN